MNPDSVAREHGLVLDMSGVGPESLLETMYQQVTAGPSHLSQPVADFSDFNSSAALTSAHVPEPSTSLNSGQPDPSYDDIFPALPEADSRPSSTKPTRVSAPAVKSSNITHLYRVAAEDMRCLQDVKPEAEQARICKDIMNKTGTVIELCSSKDRTLTFLITGKEDAVAQAKRLIGAELQTQTQAEIKVRKELHRFLLGKNGKKLSDLQTATGTRISVPRQNEESEIVKIIGTKDGIEKVMHEIQVVCTEVAARASEKLMIEKEYHPFVSGPFGETAKNIMQATGAKINIPPPSVNKNEIHISGESSAVAEAKDAILRLVADKKKKCQTVHVEVKKQQHRYVIGPKGQTLQEILKQTGVSIEMPPSENPSETITLRGEQEKLGPALTMLYEKAHSEIDEEMDAPAWLQKYIIGPKGAHFQEISQDFHSTVNVSFVSAENKIKIRGPQKDVEKALKVLENEVNRIRKEVAVRELRVDSKYHRFLIGKSGQTINQIRSKTGAQITIPAESEAGGASNVIRIEGNPCEVDSAKAELEAIIKKRMEMDSNVSKDIIIEQRFHKQIIGTKGENIRQIRDRFNQVVITFPESSVKSDKVTVKGPKEDVDNCCKYLAQLNKELLANNARIEVPIFKQFHKFLIGKDGANIKKIRDETNTTIELPAEGSDSEVIVITGKKKDVELAREKIQKFQNELINVVQVDIIIPSRIHNTIIGTGGRLIRSIMNDCGGVQIKFPAEGSGSDKVSIRGPKECVAKAKGILVELSNEKQVSSFTDEVKAKPEHHRFLIGKNGSNVNRVREMTGAQILFPSEKEDGNDTIVIVGKKEAVAAAKKELEEMAKGLERIVEDSVYIDPKYHMHFVSKRWNFLKQLSDEFGGVMIRFPRSSDKENGQVMLKGAKECVEGAKKKLLDEVSRLESLVTTEVIVDQIHHRNLMGTRGNNVKAIQAAHNVSIKFPDRRSNEKTNGDHNVSSEVTNGDAGQSDDSASVISETPGTPKRRRNDVILISGRPEDCEAAKQSLLALIPVEVEVQVPYDYHRFIIGQKGKEVRELMERYDVSVSVPPSNEKKDLIRITGPAEKVANAREAILNRVRQLDCDKQDRAARNFRVEVHVDPVLHPKIIGKKGATVTKFRKKYDVQIQFPERSSVQNGGDASAHVPDQSLITIIGYEEKALAAKEEILSLVKGMEGQVSKEVRVDARVHPRLIGARGKSVRRIMEQFKVDIKFPREGDPDPNLITISGNEDDVDAAKDHILNLEEEYLEDEGTEYAPPKPVQASRDSDAKPAAGFVVKGAPWNQQMPDTSNSEEFPSMSGPATGGENGGSGSSTAWRRQQ